jgi:amino-acid N-acetyltransferase
MLLMRLERATLADAAAVEALLAASGLPLDGAADALALGVVARDQERVVAAAAVERFGDAGLLRSVVVAPDHRGTGLGGEIVRAAEELARRDGARELYLLTETAVDWFPRLGYEVWWTATSRQPPSAIRSSSRPSAGTPAYRCAGRSPDIGPGGACGRARGRPGRALRGRSREAW